VNSAGIVCEIDQIAAFEAHKYRMYFARSAGFSNLLKNTALPYN
jgi:hypothetical protein